MSGIPARPTRPPPPIPADAMSDDAADAFTKEQRKEGKGEEGKKKVSERSPTPGGDRVRRWGRGSSQERDRERGRERSQGRGEVFSAFRKNKKPDPA